MNGGTLKPQMILQNSIENVVATQTATATGLNDNTYEQLSITVTPTATGRCVLYFYNQDVLATSTFSNLSSA